MEFSISISTTEAVGRQKNRISGMPFMLASFDLLLAFGSKGEVEEVMARKQMRNCFDNLSIALIHLL